MLGSAPVRCLGSFARWMKTVDLDQRVGDEFLTQDRVVFLPDFSAIDQITPQALPTADATPPGALVELGDGFRDADFMPSQQPTPATYRPNRARPARTSVWCWQPPNPG